MYKVLIADDEPKVCRLIQYAVDWPALGLEIAGVAENGIEALEIIRREVINIVITDIRMPGYDGLELIRRAKEVNPEINFVIISGHRQFDYAQKAIRYGVDDYLLKPIDENELTRILRKMVEHKENSRQEQEQQNSLKKQLEKDSEQIRSSFMELLVTKPGKLAVPLREDLVNEAYRCRFGSGIYQVVVIKADIPRKKNEGESYRLLQRQVRRIAENELRPDTTELLSYTAPEGVYLLVNANPSYEKDLRRRLKRIRSNICTLRDLFWDIRPTAGVGCAVEALEDIEESVASARKAILNRLYLGVNHTIGVLAEAERSLTLRDLVDAKARFKLMEGIEILNEEGVEKLLNQLGEHILTIKEMDGELLLLLCEDLIDALVLSLKKITEKSAGTDLKEEFKEAFHMCTTAEEAFETLKEFYKREIKAAASYREQSETRPIRSVKKYIEEHYDEAVKLEDMSSMIGFNPNYFSGMFKKQTGMNFSEYLTHVRIERAKQFLVEGKLSAIDIAERIGYSDAKYFYRIFKKTTGLTPTEFGRLYQKID